MIGKQPTSFRASIAEYSTYEDRSTLFCFTSSVGSGMIEIKYLRKILVTKINIAKNNGEKLSLF
jgi:hypothetical protein